MGYDLWDTETGNLVADFDDLEHALALLREELEGKGTEAVVRMSLERVWDDGLSSRIVAEGRALLELIQSGTPAE